MPTIKEPILNQPEFDGQEITADDRLMLKILSPLMVLHRLVVAPGALRRMHRLPRGRRGAPSAPGDWDNLPAVAEPYIRGAERALRSLGFGEPHPFTMPGKENRRIMAQYSLHPVDRTVGSLLVAISPRRLTIVTVAFHTFWDDGGLTITSNSEESYWPTVTPAPGVDPLALPGLEDVARLYAVHRRRCAARGRAPAVGEWDDPERNPETLLHHAGIEWEENLIRCGLYEDDGGALRTTRKGSVLMAWSRMPPWEWLITWQGRQRTKEALRATEGR
jgi:hypothetical protein